MNTTIVTVAAVLLAGCAATSNIVPMGGDTYMMSKQAATGISGLGNLKAEVLSEANAYCSKAGKKMQTTQTIESQPPYILGNYPRAEVQFSCV